MKTVRFVLLVLIFAVSAACGTQQQAPTPVPATPVPPSATPVPPTATLIPTETPTATPVPTLNIDLGGRNGVVEAKQGQLVYITYGFFWDNATAKASAEMFARNTTISVIIDDTDPIKIPAGNDTWQVVENTNPANTWSANWKWELPQLQTGKHHIRVEFYTFKRIFASATRELDLEISP